MTTLSRPPFKHTPITQLVAGVLCAFSATPVLAAANICTGGNVTQSLINGNSCDPSLAGSLTVDTGAALNGGVFFQFPSSGTTFNITNNGTISNGVGGSGIVMISPNAWITSIVNNGTITSTANTTSRGGIYFEGINKPTSTITNNGQITANGGTSAAGIRVQSASTIGSIVNTGTITSTSGFAIDLQGNFGPAAGVITNGITNTGTLAGKVNIPGATLNLNGTSVVTGAIGGSGSTINVNGTFTQQAIINTGTFNVQSGGVLTLADGASNTISTATTSGLFVNAGGNLAVPSGSTATIYGTYTQASTGIFQTGVTGTGAGQYGKLSIIGNATLAAGAKINVNVAGGASLTPGVKLLNVLSVDNINSFGNTLTKSTFTVTDNSSLFDFTVTANGTDGIDLNIIAAAPTTTRPLMNTGVKSSVFSSVKRATRIIQARYNKNKGLSSGDDFLSESEYWVKPVGSRSTQSDEGNVPGYNSTSYGIVLGHDRVLSDNVRAGLAASYITSDISSKRTLAFHDADVDGYRVIAYGTVSLDERTDINLQADIGLSKIDGSRRVDLADPTVVASSSYDNWNAHIGAGLARMYEIKPGTTFTPSVRADYTFARDESYSETGAGTSNLDVSSNSSKELILSAEAKIDHAVSEHSNLTANVGLGYDTIGERGSLTAAFVGGGTQFVTKGADPERLSFRAGLGLVTNASNGVEVTARYDYEGKSGFDDHTASVKVRMAF